MFHVGNKVREKCKGGQMGYILDIYTPVYTLTRYNDTTFHTNLIRKPYIEEAGVRQIVIINVHTGFKYYAPYDVWEQVFEEEY